MKTKLKKLQTILDEAELKYDAIELADALWLAQYKIFSKKDVTKEKKPTTKEDTTTQKKEKPETESKTENKTTNSQPVKKIMIETEVISDASVHASTKGTKKSGTGINIKQLPSTLNQNKLYNALKNFRQKRVSTTKFKLDIKKIVDTKADTSLFIPYYKPEYENKYNLVILIDNSDTMDLWSEETEKFASSIKDFNLFKSIHKFYLDSTKEEHSFFATKNKKDKNFHIEHYLKADTLVMIVSDMTAHSWRSGKLLEKLYKWQNKVTLSMIQMFPSHLWNRTILKDAEIVRFKSNRNKNFNKTLKSDLDDMLEFLDSDFKKKKLLKLPIATMELNSLEALSKVLTGKIENSIDGAIIYIEKQITQEKIELTDSEKISRFYENSSDTAHQLAHYLSVVPLDINVMILVQKLMLPESSKVHLAEILTGGIIKKDDELYQFYKKETNKDGIRDIFSNQLGTTNYFQTIKTLSTYVENNLDTGFSAYFQAILKDSETNEIGKLNKLDTEFARINIKRLKRFGGKFEKIAKRLTKEIEAIIPTSKRFQMGSNEYDDEKPIHKVVINYDFEISKYPVTFEEYDLFCEDTKREKPDDEGWGRGRKPVINISWNDAQEYCKWISKKTGEDYRLPTEAEWEYSCRAGTTTKWSFGDDESNLEKYAWYDKNSYNLGKKHPDYGTHPVGEKLPNPWGLYDMHGNVLEWCEDDFIDNYKKTPIDGKANIHEKSDGKVLRGGSCYLSDSWTRSAVRGRLNPSFRGSNVGFRLLKTLLSDKKSYLDIVLDQKIINDNNLLKREKIKNSYIVDSINFIKNKKNDFEERVKKIIELVNLGEYTTDSLVKIIKDDTVNVNIKNICISYLTKLDHYDDEITDIFVYAINNEIISSEERDEIKDEVAEALLKSGRNDQNIIEALLKLINDNDTQIQEYIREDITLFLLKIEKDHNSIFSILIDIFKDEKTIFDTRYALLNAFTTLEKDQDKIIIKNLLIDTLDVDIEFEIKVNIIKVLLEQYNQDGQINNIIDNLIEDKKTDNDFVEELKIIKYDFNNKNGKWTNKKVDEDES